ncbi:MAG: ComEC/Rec2 family competence protein [bacterium]
MIRKHPALPLLAAVVVGINLADQTRLASEWFLLGGLASLLLGLGLHLRRKAWAGLFLATSLALLAGFRLAAELYDPGPRHISHLIEDGRRYQLYGQVDDWPVIKTDRTDISLRVDSLSTGGTCRLVEGSLLIRVSDTTTQLQRGDRVALSARVYTIKGSDWPGRLDYRRYSRLKGIAGVVYVPNLNDITLLPSPPNPAASAIDFLRRSIRNSLHNHLDPGAAALAAGFLIGETRDVPPEVYRQFRDSGTLHLLAVSGSNVALVVLFFMALMALIRLPGLARSLFILVIVAVFAAVCYGEPSVVRASIMATLVILARMLQRRYDLNHLVSVTALIILLVSPVQFYQIGFQLSFVTAWAIVYSAPIITSRLRNIATPDWLRRWLMFPFLISLVAQVASAPLIAYYFERIPTISPLANLVIIPLSSLGVVGSLVLLVGDLIWPTLGHLIGWALNPILSGTLEAVRIFGTERLPQWHWPGLSGWSIWAGYLLLVLVMLSVKHRAARRWAILAGLAILNLALVLKTVGAASAPGHQVYAFGVPGGGAMIVKQPQQTVADLLILRISARRYPLDERVLSPALEAAGVSRLGSLVVLQADFGVLDDLARLALEYRADRVVTAAELRSAMVDAAGRQGVELPDLLLHTPTTAELPNKKNPD